jgi:hypothetical protein
MDTLLIPASAIRRYDGCKRRTADFHFQAQHTWAICRITASASKTQRSSPLCVQVQAAWHHTFIRCMATSSRGSAPQVPMREGTVNLTGIARLQDHVATDTCCTTVTCVSGRLAGLVLVVGTASQAEVLLMRHRAGTRTEAAIKGHRAMMQTGNSNILQCEGSFLMHVRT